MPTAGHYELTAAAWAEFRRSLYAHFHRRGIPEDKWKSNEWRWLKTKGFRKPQV